MIQYNEHNLANGLKLIVHEDRSTPMVALNVLYKVGAKNEHKDKTGFAHLFEHLMFSGSQHVADFDVPVQMAGGENNAFTNADLTNFYIVIPRVNLETALWLESDRMAALNINEHSLNIQKKVVVEEFKEVCLNQPYGDMWHHMSALAYKEHSYQWPTIGLSFEHIENASLEDVQAFYNQYYNPSNAIITVAGNIETGEAIELVERYFGWIENRGKEQDFVHPVQEPQQTEFRQKILHEDVPSTAFYQGYHMPERLSKSYYVADLISDVLCNGRSSYFYQNLYKKTPYFHAVDAYITGTVDPGLLMLEAKLHRQEDLEKAKRLMAEQIYDLQAHYIREEVLVKLLNKIESAQVYGEVSLLNKSLNLSYYAYLNDTSLINKQMEHYRGISREDIMDTAQEIFLHENCSEVIYALD